MPAMGLHEHPRVCSTFLPSGNDGDASRGLTLPSWGHSLQPGRPLEHLGLVTLGANVTLCGPSTLVPKVFESSIPGSGSPGTWMKDCVAPMLGKSEFSEHNRQCLFGGLAVWVTMERLGPDVIIMSGWRSLSDEFNGF